MVWDSWVLTQPVGDRAPRSRPSDLSRSCDVALGARGGTPLVCRYVAPHEECSVSTASSSGNPPAGRIVRIPQPAAAGRQAERVPMHEPRLRRSGRSNAAPLQAVRRLAPRLEAAGISD